MNTKGNDMLKNTKLNVLIGLIIVLVIAIIFLISRSAKGGQAEMLLFYSPTCPHCHAAMEFLDNKVAKKYPELKITKHNTSTRSGANYYMYYKKKLQWDGNGVPVAVFGDKYEMGFGSEDNSGKNYIKYIDEMFENTKENK